MTTGTVQVRTATGADITALTETLADAFQLDPVMSWCYPEAARRAEILTEVFRTVLEHTLPHGGVETVEGTVAGAIWVPAGSELDDAAMAEAVLEVSGEHAERVAAAFELMDAHHPTAADHEYLFFLGARAPWRSKGLGSALLRSVTARCDRDRLGAYLEATSERNRSLYERHGFEVTGVIRLPDGPPLWCMWRDPQH